jgi:hypothetical protein
VTLSVAPPQITSANATAFTSGVFGSFTVIATGAPTPALTQTGALPAGVSFVDNGNGTATLSGTPAPSSVGVYPLTLRATNGIGSGFTQAFTLTVQAPPGIANLQLGPVVAGFANQRSRIDSIVVTFSESLSIHPDSAFSLTRTTNSTAVALTVTYNADFSRATLTFSGPNVSGGSLIDGRYRLTVDGSQLITAGGVAIDADGDRAPGGTLTVDFHRLFGDSDGDADTDFTDLARFRLALGGPSTTPLIVYNPVFDSDGDGDVDFTDLAQFRLRLGTVLP